MGNHLQEGSDLVSITYGHGFLDDCHSTTGWTPTRSGMTDAQSTFQAYYDDILEFDCLPNDAGDEYIYCEKDITNFSTDIYTKFKIRLKTSVASAGMGSRVTAVFTDGSQELLEATGIPQYSSNALWTVISGTFTSGKTVDKVRIWADDYPNTVSGAVWYQVDYDFILFYKNDFVFPNTILGPDFDPQPRIVDIDIPGRGGDITQGLGTKLAVVTMSCDLDQGTTWKRPQSDPDNPTDKVKGQVFHDIWHNAFQEPFQWLNLGSEKFKATLRNLSFSRSNDGQRTLDLEFREYRRGSANNESYVERFGLNIT